MAEQINDLMHRVMTAVVGVSGLDINTLASRFWARLDNPDPDSFRILYRLIGANMNTTADQAFEKLHDYAAYTLQFIRINNASVNMNTAVGGIYTGANKTGITLVANTQTFTTLTTPAKGQAMSLIAADATGVLTADPILSLTTPQGVAATADIAILGWKAG